MCVIRVILSPSARHRRRRHRRRRLLTFYRRKLVDASAARTHNNIYVYIYMYVCKYNIVRARRFISIYVCVPAVLHKSRVHHRSQLALSGPRLFPIL